MLPLLEVFLILCLVSMLVGGWEKQLPLKLRNKFVVASFNLSILPMASRPLREKWESGVWNKGIFRILSWILSTSYVYIILFSREATASRVFPYPAIKLKPSTYIYTPAGSWVNLHSRGLTNPLSRRLSRVESFYLISLTISRHLSYIIQAFTEEYRHAAKPVWTQCN